MFSRDKSGVLGNVLGKREKAQRNKIPAVSWSPGRNSVKPSVCRPGGVKEKVWLKEVRGTPRTKSKGETNLPSFLVFRTLFRGLHPPSSHQHVVGHMELFVSLLPDWETALSPLSQLWRMFWKAKEREEAEVIAEEVKVFVSGVLFLSQCKSGGPGSGVIVFLHRHRSQDEYPTAMLWAWLLSILVIEDSA